MEALLSKMFNGQESQENYLKDIKDDLSRLNQKVESHAMAIK